MSDPTPRSLDIRRLLVLICAVLMLVACAASTFWEGLAGTSDLVTAATGRIGLVLGALWLAWPSLQKPASWLPPGVATLLLVGLVILAARPRLAVLVVPAFGILMALATVIRVVKGK